MTATPTSLDQLVKTHALLETQNQLLYEVQEKKDPSKTYTLKLFKSTPKNYPSLLDTLFLTNSDHPLSHKIRVFPKLFSCFKAWDAAYNSQCDCLLFEQVPSFLGILRKDLRPIGFETLYKYYQSLVDGLAYLQLNGMFHGSLCPEVVGCTASKTVRLMDFEQFNYGIGDTKTSNLMNNDPQSVFLAPELRQALVEEKHLRFDGNKADSYSLASIILWLADEELENLEEEKASPQSFKNQIEEKIGNLRTRFEEEIPGNRVPIMLDFLNSLLAALELDPKERPSPLALFRNTMKFIDRRQLIGFLGHIEENIESEQIIEWDCGMADFELKSQEGKANDQLRWKVTGKAAKPLISEVADRPDPCKPEPLRGFLKGVFETLSKLKSEKSLENYDRVSLQASPSRQNCQGNPEREYLYSVLFRKAETENANGFSMLISHETNYWNGISNEITQLLLTGLNFTSSPISLRLGICSWLDLTAPGIKKIAESLQKLNFHRVRNLEIGLYSHSADSFAVCEILAGITKNMKAFNNHKLETLTFYVFSSSIHDPTLSAISDLISFSPNLKELSVNLRQLTKSANFAKFEDSLSVPMLSALNSLRIGFTSTTVPYIEDSTWTRLFAKLNKGLSANNSIHSLGIYLLTWGEIDKGFYGLLDLLRERRLALDLYFYGKGPDKENEQDLQSKIKSACARSNPGVFYSEFSVKRVGNSPSLKG